MESKSKDLIIDTEEELYSNFNKIYQKLKEDEYCINMSDAPSLLKNLNLIESKAKEFSVISPNEEVDGNIWFFMIT
jgi:hypothetical protein